ncbi:MAG TPA: S41 family peptidase [Pyrinomonadaceae bacterium]|jgi:carboxyl-terminal processing protease|nr:S41 family peptidase [Pyrinomonadaceae bacterium]
MRGKLSGIKSISGREARGLRASRLRRRASLCTRRASLLWPLMLVLLFIQAALPSSTFSIESLSGSAQTASSLPLAVGVARADAGGVTTLTREGRLAVFDDVWETVSERYYDPAFHGVDWQAQRAAFRPQAALAVGASELYDILRRMVGSLRDAHTRVYPPDEKFDWQHPHFLSVGISVREVAAQPVVVQVERGSLAERAGLRAGDLITSVDGEPAQALFARRLKEQSGFSTVAATRLHAMATLFAGPRDSTVLVGWIDAGGVERETRLLREWRERDATLHVERLKGDYGLVQFDAFTPESARDFLHAMEGKLAGVRGLVLDLRNNGGGEAEAMTEMASAFLPVGSRLGQFIDRAGRVADAPQTRAAMLFAPETINRFSGPVVVLTSERTSSAAEIFTAALKEARRAIIIGGPTCGCVLAIRHQHALPDGGELDVSEMDYKTDDGTRLEGVGITPDETVKLNRKDLHARRDHALQRALERLKS